MVALSHSGSRVETMAENTTNAVIVLSAGKQIEVQDSVEHIQALIADAPRGEMSFMKVTDERGMDRWINVREIVEFHASTP
jgi:hypothetical protein